LHLVNLRGLSGGIIPTIPKLCCMWDLGNRGSVRLEGILLRIGRRFGGKVSRVRRRASGTTDMLEVEGIIAGLLGWLLVVDA
jgi:hypothetical protein